MGLSLIVHLEEGFNEWLKQGGAIETIHKKYILEYVYAFYFFLISLYFFKCPRSSAG